MRPAPRVNSKTEELAILRQSVHHVTEKINISAKAKKSFVTVSNQWIQLIFLVDKSVQPKLTIKCAPIRLILFFETKRNIWEGEENAS